MSTPTLDQNLDRDLDRRVGQLEGIAEQLDKRFDSMDKRLDRIEAAQRWIPDETTICKFRHFLHRHGLIEVLFERTVQHRSERGLLMRAGTIVDATIGAAPTSTKNRDRARDPEMGSTQKGTMWHFGIIKHRWGYRKVRYRGLANNVAQLVTLFALANLYLVRRQLQAA